MRNPAVVLAEQHESQHARLGALKIFSTGDPWVGPAQGIDSTISQKRSPFHENEGLFQSFQSFQPGLSAFKAFNRYAQFKSFKTSEDQI